MKKIKRFQNHFTGGRPGHWSVLECNPTKAWSSGAHAISLLPPFLEISSSNTPILVWPELLTQGTPAERLVFHQRSSVTLRISQKLHQTTRNVYRIPIPQSYELYNKIREEPTGCQKNPVASLGVERLTCGLKTSGAIAQVLHDVLLAKCELSS